MRKTLLLLNFCFLLLAKVAAQGDFIFDSIHVISGLENYQGKSDLSGKVKVSSTSEKIIVEVQVTDDLVLLNSDLNKSDRVEVWYSLPEAKEGFDENYLYKVDSSQAHGMKFYSFSSSIRKKTSDTSQSGKVLYGKVHYAFVPDSRQVVWLDKQNYTLLEKATGEKPGHIEQGVQFRTERNKNGYKLIISISPLGLGFIKIPSMNELCLRIDFVDIDKDGAESRFSTLKLGSKTCHVIKLDKPLKTNVTTVPNYIYDSLKYTPTLLFNDKGYWSGIERKEICLDSVCKEKELLFLRTPIGYKKWIVGNAELERINKIAYKCQNKDTTCLIDGQTQEFYFINKKKYESSRWIYSKEWLFKGLTKEVALPDGNLGLILIKVYTADSCRTSTNKELELLKFRTGKSISLLKVVQNDCKGIGKVGDFTIPGYIVEKIYWQKEGVVLIIEGRVPTIGSRKFKVTFLGDKAVVSEIKSKK